MSMKSSSSRGPSIIIDDLEHDRITADDIVRAIRRPPSDRIVAGTPSASPSVDEKKSHTFSSRLSFVKSAIGIAKPRTSIYTGHTQHNDYQR
jgi:hypothetical protein